MRWIGVIVAIAMIVIVFIDAFESVVLPRRIKHNYRLARLFYRSTWRLWRASSRLLPAGKWRYGFLSGFGPLSLVGLLGLWASVLIFAFALLHWSAQTALSLPGEGDDRFDVYLYFSGTTFFTLGYGDAVPTGFWGRALSVAQAGMGFGFLATIISYLPVLYQTFSRRETAISLLDARAGSPPTAGELLRRMVESKGLASVAPLFVEWERWSAELLESQLSFPVVSYYRSQHDNQSWVGALTMILDTSALWIAARDDTVDYQARLTFAAARHAAVDLGLVFYASPNSTAADRLSSTQLTTLYETLHVGGLTSRDATDVEARLTRLRRLYEPFVDALAQYFELELPPFVPEKPPVDNWQTSPVLSRAPGLCSLGTGVEMPQTDEGIH